MTRLMRSSTQTPTRGLSLAIQLVLGVAAVAVTGGDSNEHGILSVLWLSTFSAPGLLGSWPQGLHLVSMYKPVFCPPHTPLTPQQLAMLAVELRNAAKKSFLKIY